MCGRYAFDDIREIYEARQILDQIAQRLGSDAAAGIKTGEVFPTETAAVLAQSKQGALADVMRWGYPYARKIVINARSETLLQRPAFRKSLRGGRCLIPCTGFFEWKREQGGKKKYMIRPEGASFFYLAGLFDRFLGEECSRFVIITAPASASMREIHDRMPLIVPAAATDMWLDDKYTEDISDRVRRICVLTDTLDKTAV